MRFSAVCSVSVSFQRFSKFEHSSSLVSCIGWRYLVDRNTGQRCCFMSLSALPKLAWQQTLCLFRVFKNLLIYLFIYLENKKTSTMKIEEIFISSSSLLMLVLYTHCMCSDNGSKDSIPIPDSSPGAVIWPVEVCASFHGFSSSDHHWPTTKPLIMFSTTSSDLSAACALI